jgi:2,3-bisphosphoglycerate-dependent phosphoglycerate mutase
LSYLLYNLGVLELTFIRHGETIWNAEGRFQGHLDSPLTALGIRQAKALNKRLSGQSFDTLYSSDSGRVLQTASLVFPNKPSQQDMRLREIHYGVIEGKTRAEFSTQEEAMYTHTQEDRFYRRITHGENWQDLQTRLQDWMNSLPKEGRVAVVTHGGVIRAALFLLVGFPQNYAWNARVDNTSGSRFYISSKQKMLIGFNDAAHLENVTPDFDT